MSYLNFSWILEGALAGAQGPTSRRDLTFLKLKEVRAIVRMEEHTISGDAAELVDLYEPVPDGSPPQPSQIERLVRFIEDQIEKWERPVVVTCYAGLGRTGTVLACYLVHVGYTAHHAVKLVRDLRPGSIQTAEQEAAVHQFAGLVKSRERDQRRRTPEGLGDR